MHESSSTLFFLFGLTRRCSLSLDCRRLTSSNTWHKKRWEKKKKNSNTNRKTIANKHSHIFVEWVLLFMRTRKYTTKNQQQQKNPPKNELLICEMCGSKIYSWACSLSVRFLNIWWKIWFFVVASLIVVVVVTLHFFPIEKDNIRHFNLYFKRLIWMKFLSFGSFVLY